MGIFVYFLFTTKQYLVLSLIDVCTHINAFVLLEITEWSSLDNLFLQIPNAHSSGNITTLTVKKKSAPAGTAFFLRNKRKQEKPVK